MYGNIMVPVDGSKFSEQAIPYASAIAGRAGARLHVVLVHTPLARLGADIAPTLLMGQWEDQYRNKEIDYLNDLIERLGQQGRDVVAEKLEGDVAHQLVERAKSNADLLIMATHGRAGLERAWLGSVADEVVHHVQLPVLLIRPEDDAVRPKDPRFEHVLVASDGSEAAAAATEQAVQLAGLFGSRLTLLRVASMPAGLTSPYIPHAALIDRETTERREKEAEEFLDGVAAKIAKGVTVQTHVARAYHPAHGILDAITELKCDLVALGTRRHTRLARIVLGSVADKIVRASPVPVLVGHTKS